MRVGAQTHVAELARHQRGLLGPHHAHGNISLAAQQVAHQRGQLFQLDRLDQVHIGASLDAIDALRALAAGGGDDHPFALQGAAALQPIEPVAIAQTQVQNQDIEQVGSHPLRGRIQAGNAVGHKAFHVQVGDSGLQQLGLVFNHQHAAWGVFHKCHGKSEGAARLCGSQRQKQLPCPSALLSSKSPWCN